MKTPLFYVVVVFILPLATSQPTTDIDVSSCQQQQDSRQLELLQMFSWIKSEMAELKALISQRNNIQNVTKSPSTYM